MMTPAMPALASLDDLELVNRSRTGDRDAFGELVGRYQSLVCSITYSSTGSLSQSEDIAQETFFAAWLQLANLREPAKLRSWLCGIARNLSNNAARKRAREPIHQSASLDAIADQPTNDPLPTDQAVTREEEELLWRAVERIPETYREPLILFYRERQSVESVARSLDLTEDAAKQRLSRGRKLLENQLASFVESTLSRTAPGRAFTLGVLAALPAFALSASAATVGASAAKGTAVATSTSLLIILNSFLGPIIGIAGAYIGVKAGLNATRTPRERQFMVRQTKMIVAATILFNLSIFAYVFFAIRYLRVSPIFVGSVGVLIPLGFAAFILIMSFRCNKQFQKLRDEEQQLHPQAYSPAERAGVVREYRSKASFLGLPLIHFRSGRLAGQPHEPAIGWFAFGDRAYGILVAGGGIAVGSIAMGGLSVGLVSVGGACLGGLALGGLAVGGLSFGGAAIGVVAIGGLGVAYIAAEGGLAIAHQFAIGGQAIAIHANDLAAREFFRQFRWLDIMRPEVRNTMTLIGWLPLLLIFLGVKKARDAQKKTQG